MKRSGFIALFFISSCLALAQRQGIKLLVRDRETGATLRDSLQFTINDLLKIEAVPDTNGYFFFSLPAGKYSVRVSRRNYYTHIVNGINVGENRTYLTIDLSKPDQMKKKTKNKKRKKK